MNEMDDELRRAVQLVSAQAKPADLLQRSLSTARRIRRVRTGAAVSATAVVVAALGVGGWSIASHNRSAGDIAPATSPTAGTALPPSPKSATPTAPASVRPTSVAPTSVPPSPASPTSTPVSLPILVSPELSTPGQDAADLLPSSCTVENGVATAKGTFAGYYQTYSRYGDVVQLYVFTGTPKTAPTTMQLAELPNPSQPPLSTGSWQVSAPIAAAAGQRLFCLVTVQSTHAFIGAPAG